MKFLTFTYANERQVGILGINNNIYSFNSFQKLFEEKTPKTLLDAIPILDEPLLGEIETLISQEEVMPICKLSDVTLHAPIEFPKRNIICLGKNYKDHCKEMEGKTSDLIDIPSVPIYFSKMATPAIGKYDEILINSSVTNEVDYEVELAVVIGREGCGISKEDAFDYVFGYMVANDVSARDVQMRHIQWLLGKSQNTFCPLGPWLTHKSAIDDPSKLRIYASVNGEMRQDSVTDNLIFDIPTIISDLSRGMTLYPGDVILTGTPAGVGMGFDPPKYLKDGDVVVCGISGLGELQNPVRVL